MSASASPREDRSALNGEDIARLTQEGGKPAETLMNVVALIARRFQTDVCSAYLLEPDRANLVLAATVGLRRECIGTLRLALHEGLAGLVAEQVRPVAVEQAQKHPRFKYFGEAGEDAYQSFLGVPLIDRGVLQGVLVVQTVEARAFREDEIRMLTEAAAQVAPVVSEARTLDRFIAPAQERLWSLARNLWWSWDHDSISLFRDLDPARWRQLNHNPISLLAEMPLAQSWSAAPPNWCCTAASTTRTAASRNICRPTAPGARRMPAFCDRVRWPISRPSSGCTNRSRSTPAAWACWPATTSRAPPIWTFRWSASACSTARDTSASGWTGTAGSRKSTCRRTSTSCPWSRPSATNGEPVTVRDRNAQRASSAPRSGA